MDMVLGDGPMISGNWFNPSTGDSFTVRDCFFEDNNPIIMTTDGRRLDYNMISQYTQTDHPIPKQNLQQKQASIPQSILSEVLPVQQQNNINQPISQPSALDTSLMTEEDLAMLNVPVNPVATTQNNGIYNPNTTTTVDEDTLLVRRLLKRSVEPQIKCCITWDKFPSKQMEMLDMMGVDVEKISDYYISKIDLNTIREVIKENIVSYIEKSICPDDTKEKEPVDISGNCFFAPTEEAQLPSEKEKTSIMIDTVKAPKVKKQTTKPVKNNKKNK